jgi:uncharacterized protein (TIGR02246 family)
MKLTRRTAFAGLASATTLLSAEAAAQDIAVTEANFAAWLERYKQAWEARDAALASALFTEDATYHEKPFDAPMQGRAAIEAYWTRVTAPQSNIHFTYDVVACAGDQGVAHWHAAFTVEGGTRIELDGVFVCAFADAETVRHLREWWDVQATAPEQ